MSLRSQKEEAILGEDYEGAARLRDEEKRLSEELESRKNAAAPGSSGEMVVDAGDIADIVTSWTGIPVKKLAEEEGERLMKLDAILRERVIGQDAAVEAVCRAIRRGRMGLKDPRRPIGSFIFLGPTGVGKTELCRVLARELYFCDGADDNLVLLTGTLCNKPITSLSVPRSEFIKLIIYTCTLGQLTNILMSWCTITKS